MRISAQSLFAGVFFAIYVTFLSVNTSVLGDDLFSDVAIESVFRSEAAASEVSYSKDDLVADSIRVTGAGSLMRVLDEAGLQPTKVERHVVSVAVVQGGLSLPVLMSVVVDQDRLDMVMLLSELGDQIEWDTQRLAKLLTANAEEGTVFFSLGDSSKRIELRRSMSNRLITPGLMKEELRKMLRVAETYEDTWSNVAKDGSSVAKHNGETQAATPSSDRPNGSTSLTLVGRWSAAIASGEALAVQIARDGKFQMVVVKAGKTTVSTGTAQRTGNTLTLTDTNGTKIEGTVKQTTADSFELAIGGNQSATLNFKRAE